MKRYISLIVRILGLVLIGTLAYKLVMPWSFIAAIAIGWVASLVLLDKDLWGTGI